MKEVFGIVGIVVLLLIAVGVGPALTILSINALFNTGIVLNFWNWLAMFWLQSTTVGVISAGLRSKK